MNYNEAYELRKAEQSKLFKKYEKALDGIKSEHMAQTTAICLENYMQYLKANPALIAEDQVQTGSFTGVNLALLGLIARVIPTIIGAELVGFQAMPTPRSPIFTMLWKKDAGKGKTVAGEEMWQSPNPSGYSVGLDPFYSSHQVRDEMVGGLAGHAAYVLKWANVQGAFTGTKPFLFPNSLYVVITNKATGDLVDEYQLVGDLSVDGTLTRTAKGVASGAGIPSIFAWSSANRTVDPDVAWNFGTYNYFINYEYKAEAEPSMPEISFNISETYVDLITRKLRGKYTIEAAYDIKVLHGINLDSEISDMMKMELTAEINREIVSDLRMAAEIVYTLDLTALGGGPSIAGNYDDFLKVLLDSIMRISAKIYSEGRLGYATWVLGNPETVALLTRTGGFVTSGVQYNGKELSFIGTTANALKVYADPNYPQNELLFGYKGPGALDAGYMHCPYLPITASPQMINPETGDPSKFFYTRFGKTWSIRGGGSDGSFPSQKILNGGRQYGRLMIKGLPTILS